MVHHDVVEVVLLYLVTICAMGLLPNTSNCGCACTGNAGNVFPATMGKQSRHASRHVRDARAVMHAGIANSRYPLNSAAEENFPGIPGIPGACTTRNFTYLVRGPYSLCLLSQIYTKRQKYERRFYKKHNRWKNSFWCYEQYWQHKPL